MVTMVLGGLWHGAAWNFVIWGTYHGILLSLDRVLRRNGKPEASSPGSLSLHLLKAAGMFQLTCLGWVFFRSKDMAQAGVVLNGVFLAPWDLVRSASMLSQVMFYAAVPVFVMAVQAIREMRPLWSSRGVLGKYYGFADLPLPERSMVYGILSYLLFLYGAKAETFIYFQF